MCPIRFDQIHPLALPCLPPPLNRLFPTSSNLLSFFPYFHVLFYLYFYDPLEFLKIGSMSMNGGGVGWGVLFTRAWVTHPCLTMRKITTDPLQLVNLCTYFLE